MEKCVAHFFLPRFILIILRAQVSVRTAQAPVSVTAAEFEHAGELLQNRKKKKK